MPKTEQVTKYNATAIDKNGATILNSEGDNPHLYVSEETLNKAKTKVEADGGQFEVTRAQSFTITEAESLEEAATLFPKRALEFLNYGARLAQQNVMRDNMRDEEWAGVEGSFDLLPEIQEPKERKKASPRDKAINLLAKIAKDAGKELDRSAIEAILSQFMPATEEAAA
jgi:hypothetical protein